MCRRRGVPDHTAPTDSSSPAHVGSGRCVLPCRRAQQRASIMIAPSVLPADFARLGRGVARRCRRRPDPVGRDGRPVRAQPHLRARRDRRRDPPRCRSGTPDGVPARAARCPLRRGRLQSADRARRGTTHLPEPLPRSTAGASAGVALNPATPVAAIEHVLDLIDMVLVMTVNPGFGGQRYLTSMEPKITEVRHARTPRPVGSNPSGGRRRGSAPTVVGAAAAGANVLIAEFGDVRSPDGKAAAVTELLRSPPPAAVGVAARSAPALHARPGR